MHSRPTHRQLALLSALACPVSLMACDGEPPAVEAQGEGIVFPTARAPEPEPESDNPSQGEAEESCGPAESLFPYAVCVCEDLDDAGVLDVYGMDGPALVGVNARTVLAGLPVIDGSAVFHGGLETSSAMEITGSLASAGDVLTSGFADIGADLDVGGDLRANGLLFVGEELRVRGEERTGAGLIDAGGRADYVAPPLPCGCEPQDLLDIEGRVSSARDDNHNESIGLSADLAVDAIERIELPTGRYYLESGALEGFGELVVAGHVSLYVDGSIDLVGIQSIELAETGTLDLFVSGSVRSVGVLTAGAKQRPGAFRMYVGGQDAVSISSGISEFYGSIYAPRAEVKHDGLTTIVGSIFARRITSGGVFTVEYAPPERTPAGECPDACAADPDAGGCGYPPDYVPEG